MIDVLSTQEFVDLFFDEGEYVCYGQNIRQNRGFQKAFWKYYKPNFFSINPLKPKTTRCRENISAFRNFMMESDTLPLEKQEDYFLNSGLPISALVYSGGKSIHAFICLDQDIGQESWEEFLLWLHKALPYIDHACKDPGRLSRFANALRADTNKIQELEYISERMNPSSLELALKKLCDKPIAIKHDLILPKEGVRYPLKRSTNDYIAGIYPDHGRQHGLYVAACDFAEKGYSMEECSEKLYLKFPFTHDFPQSEFSRTIECAFKKLLRMQQHKK